MRQVKDIKFNTTVEYEEHLSQYRPRAIAAYVQKLKREISLLEFHNEQKAKTINYLNEGFMIPSYIKQQQHENVS